MLVGGLMLVLPELALPGRLGRWLGAALDILFVLACALGLSRIAVAALTEYAARNPAVRPGAGRRARHRADRGRRAGRDHGAGERSAFRSRRC